MMSLISCAVTTQLGFLMPIYLMVQHHQCHIGVGLLSVTKIVGLQH